MEVNLPEVSSEPCVSFSLNDQVSRSQDHEDQKRMKIDVSLKNMKGSGTRP